MTVASSSPSNTKSNSPKKRPFSGEDGGQVKRKRTKSPVVRVINGRIYDPKNGRTCHQCRQKTMDFSASCKNLKGNKPCTLHICHKCLLNRYGEIAEEVSQSGDWLCPRCRGICNCSFCMKKKGHKPTGTLVYAAKATGLGSASNLIEVKGVENLDDLKRPILLKKKFKVTSPSKIGVYRHSNTSRDETWSSTDSTPESDHKKSGQATNRKGKKGSVKMSNSDCCGRSVEMEESFDSDIDRADAYVARQGIKKRSTNLEHAQVGVNPPLRKIDILRTALGIDLSPEDVGVALQFLEFCASFGKACKVSKNLMRSGQKMDIAASSLAKVDSAPFAENHTQVPTPTSTS